MTAPRHAIRDLLHHHIDGGMLIDGAVMVVIDAVLDDDGLVGVVIVAMIQRESGPLVAKAAQAPVRGPVTELREELAEQMPESPPEKFG